MSEKIQRGLFWLWKALFTVGCHVSGTLFTRVVPAVWKDRYWEMLFSPHRVYPIQGSKMYLGPSDSFAGRWITGQYEKGTAQLFRDVLRPGMICVDVGAHMGYYTLLAARLVGERGRVYAFEPEPTNDMWLHKNISLNTYRNVITVKKAVSDHTGSARLLLGKNSSIHSLFYQFTFDGRTPEDVIPVETVTLDLFFEEEGWPSINLIKMDIEGAEPRALAGARKILQRSEQLKLIVEFSPKLLSGAGVIPETFLDQLYESYGFKTIWMIDDQQGLLPVDRHYLLTHDLPGDYVNLFCEK